MRKQVLVVGNCGADHAAIRALLTATFDASVLAAHTAAETLAALRSGPCDLVLINRILDRDGSDGVDVIRQVRAIPELAAVPLMLITNYPEHQQRAVAAGAALGFGKSQLHAPETREKLSRFLG